MARQGLVQKFGNSGITVLQARLELASFGRNREIIASRMGTAQVLPSHYDPLQPPQGMSESFRDLSSYYRTQRGRHPRAPNTCLPQSWDLMANYDAFQCNRMISPRPLLAIAWSQAVTRWCSEDAVANMGNERGELLVEGMTHADLYDHVDIAGERLVDYFGRYLVSNGESKHS